jgi:hypothetical protein
MLKPHKGPPTTESGELPTMNDGVALPELESMLKARANGDKIEVLIKWKDQPATDSSWEEIGHFKKLYPKFQLKDELILQEGIDVTIVKHPRGCPRKVAAARLLERGHRPSCYRLEPPSEDRFMGRAH